MHAYCINLDKRTDRRDQARAEFDREGLDVEFFSATDGRIDPPDGLYLTPPEYGCAMSHVRVWRDMVEKGHEMALIFEDDVCLVPNFKTKLEEILSEVKDIPWDIINLGSVFPILKQNVSPSLFDGTSLGAHAYLIRLECARKISVFDPKLFKLPVDIQVTKYPIRMLNTRDVLAKQTNLEVTPSLGIINSCIHGDIGFERTIDLDYNIRYSLQKFNFVIALVIAFIILIFLRN